jgi:hypothetical protein
LRPSTIVTSPCGLNFITMFDPSSITRGCLLVEADRVGEREAVGVLAPLLDVLAGLVELEQLGGLRAARRPTLPLRV